MSTDDDSMFGVGGKIYLATILNSISLVFLYYSGLLKGLWIAVPVGIYIIVLATVGYSYHRVSGGILLIGVLAGQMLISSMFIVPQYSLFGWDSPPMIVAASKLLSGVPALEAHPTPGSSLIIATVVEISSIPIQATAKYLPLIFLGGTAAALFMITRTEVSIGAAVIPPLLLATIPWHSNFRSWAIKEAPALPLFLIALFLLLRSTRISDNRRYSILILVLTTSITTIHHLSTMYLLLIALIVFSVGWIGNILKPSHTPNRLPNLAFLTSDRNSTAILTVIIGMVVLVYWAYFYILPFLVVAESLAGFGMEWGGAAPSVELTYGSLYDQFRLTWKTSEYQLLFVISLIFGGFIYKAHKKSQFIDRTALSLIAFCALLCTQLVLTIIFDIGITHNRAFIWLWIPSFILFAKLYQEAGLKRLLYVLAIIFLSINIIFLPYHVVSSYTAAYNAGESDQEYTKADYKAAEWLSYYGVHKVSSQLQQIRFWQIFGVEAYDRINNTALHLILPSDESYLYIDSMARDYTMAGFGPDSSDNTPPNYDAQPILHRIYSSQNRTMYITS